MTHLVISVLTSCMPPSAMHIIGLTCAKISKKLTSPRAPTACGINHQPENQSAFSILYRFPTTEVTVSHWISLAHYPLKMVLTASWWWQTASDRTSGSSSLDWTTMLKSSHSSFLTTGIARMAYQKRSSPTTTNSSFPNAGLLCTNWQALKLSFLLPIIPRQMDPVNGPIKR